MKRFHVRVAVIEALKLKGLYVGDADNPMAIPICSKSGDIIESVMKPQWWVSCKAMAQEAIAVRPLPPLPPLLRTRLTRVCFGLGSAPRRESSRSGPLNLREIGTDGLRPSRTGASRVSFGTVTASRRTLSTSRARSRM